MLVTKQTVRMEHPTEEGAWVDVAVPLTAGDMAAVGDAATDLDFTCNLLAVVITGWSEPAPVTPENIRALDLPTYTWLAREALARSGVRSNPETPAG